MIISDELSLLHHAWNEIQMFIAHQNSQVNRMVIALHNSIDVDANLIGEIHLASSSFQDNDTEKHWYHFPCPGLLNEQSGNIESSK